MINQPALKKHTVKRVPSMADCTPAVSVYTPAKAAGQFFIIAGQQSVVAGIQSVAAGHQSVAAVHQFAIAGHLSALAGLQSGTAGSKKSPFSIQSIPEFGIRIERFLAETLGMTENTCPLGEGKKEAREARLLFPLSFNNHEPVIPNDSEESVG